MTQRSRFLSIGFSLLVVLCFSCTTHQQPVSQSGAPSALGASAAVSTGVGVGAVDSQLVNNGPSGLQEQAARTQAAQSDPGGGPVAFFAVKMVETAPVSSLAGSTAEADPTQSQPGVERNELNDVQVKQNMPGNGPTAPPALASLSVPSPAPGLTFEGNSSANNTAVFGSTVAPPDTNGAVGPKHYVEMTNDLVGIYTKAGALVSPPGRFPPSAVFSALGGLCANTNDGDPIVLYDKLADRWILSQFGFTSSTVPPFHECVAISKTADPTGAYYAYDFVLPGTEFPDYPKLGTWPDAYYMTTNQFNNGGPFDGGGAFALDRTKMLVGDPTPGGIYFNLNLTTHPEGIFGMLPSDFDGLTPPPAGAPNVFAYPTSVTFGDPADGIRLFDFRVGVPFGTGPTFIERPESTYAAPVSVAAWDLRDPGGRGDINQPPPASGSADRLDSVASRLMHRMQYYNHAGTEKLVTNITVNTSGVTPNNAANYRASIRYLELQRTGGTFSVNEQGTHSPTADARWMGSAAEDDSGDIAVGYSISSTTVHPSLAYAGRVPSDPAGTLEGEQTLFAGTGVQRATSNRWGDYSAMQLDPTDFCTFWYTNEYYTTTASTFNWRTRIGNFKFPTCVSPAMGTLIGNVTYCQSGDPITGAVITVSDGHGGATIANGTYSIALPPGTYMVTATDPAANCATSAPQSVTIGNGGTATANFCLTGTPLIDLVGASVDDSPGNGNGTINRDECFRVNAVLKNDGCFSESGISAILSTSTPGVVVDQPSSAYPDLAINARGGNVKPYRVHTTPGFVCGTPIVFALSETGSLGGPRLFSFSFPTCAGPAQPFVGTLVNTDLVATNGRLGRNAVSSVCGTAKGCPGPITPITPKFYDTFSFANTSAVTECLNINLNQSSCSGNLIAGAYLDSFDGTNLCANYLGDAGASPAVGSFQVNVPPGHNLIVSIQQVTDGLLCATGYSGTVTGFVDDTDAGGQCPPALTTTVSTSSLWPPNHGLVNVGLAATATDDCGPITTRVQVFSDEDDVDPQTDGDMSPDAKDIAVGTLRLRTERSDSGDGRVYLVVVRATDACGTKFTANTVVVTHDQSKGSINSVNAQAAAARAFCLANGGAPPPGYFVIGDGPVIGSKQ